MYEVPNQDGKFAIVTGSNSGTGWEAARKLAAAEASVIMAVRTVSKGEEAKAKIFEQHPGADMQVRRLDLADQASVKEFADQIIADGRSVDLLLNNAGVMMLPKRHETVDGFEMQMGTNFFGPFALTVRLLPALLLAKAPRVVTMTSTNQQAINFDNLDWSRRYSAIGAYARSKLADALVAQELARLAIKRGWNLLSLSAHPGTANTNIFENGKQLGGNQPLLLRILAPLVPSHSAEGGADPMLYAATRVDVVQGSYYGPEKGMTGSPAPAKLSKRAQDEAVAARLWETAERRTGASVKNIE